MNSEGAQSVAALLVTARAMLNGELGLIEGCRRIDSLRFGTDDPDDHIFDTFRAVASETDHLPLGDVRKLASEAYLARVDREASEYVARASRRILDACESLIRLMSTAH